jgi:hypothetical protein
MSNASCYTCLHVPGLFGREPEMTSPTHMLTLTWLTCRNKGHSCLIAASLHILTLQVQLTAGQPIAQ